MPNPSTLLDACTKAIDRFKRTLEQPGLVSVRILIKLDDSGSPVDCLLTPEFRTLQSPPKVPRLPHKIGS